MYKKRHHEGGFLMRWVQKLYCLDCETMIRGYGCKCHDGVFDYEI